MDGLQSNQSSAPGPKNIPIELLIDLSQKNLSYSQIAKQVGCTSSNIIQRFNAIDYTPARVEAFKRSRADFLAFTQSRILNSITMEDINKANLQTKVISFGILHDKEMIERRNAAGIQIDDCNMDDLQSSLSRIATRAPLVINNILNVVGNLPGDIRDRIGKLIPMAKQGQHQSPGDTVYDHPGF